MAQIIRRALLQSFDPLTYTASILLLEATSSYLTDVPVNFALDASSALPNALCAVLFFDETNSSDAVIIAVYNNRSQLPSPQPGRLQLVTGYQHINASVIASGVTTSFTVTGGSSGIPTTARAVVYKAHFTSSTVGAYLQMAPKGASIGAYVTLGNIPVANTTPNQVGILPLNNGQMDVKANNGTCTFSFYTYGYVL